jgi:hypothetical protein
VDEISRQKSGYQHSFGGLYVSANFAYHTLVHHVLLLEFDRYKVQLGFGISFFFAAF